MEEKMKKGLIVLLFVVMAWGLFAAGQKDAGAAFPSKPIRLVVYTAAGGQLDVTARKFVEIAGKYTNATFVVENKPGAGGIIGWEYILSQPADGYNLMAVTKTLIANLVGTEAKIDPQSLDWIAYMINDPEAIITNAKSKIRTPQEIFADAKARPGQQIWVAPPGVDEVMTYKVWDKAGLSGKYVPFDAGGQAMAQVIGGQAQVYVGNPVDVAGKPDLMISVVSSEKRLPQFPDVPTFKELGIQGLDNESLWRGFAVKRGTPDNVIAWYDDLFAKVSADSAWRQTWEKNAMQLFHYKRDKFNEMIKTEVQDFKTYLKK
jgi:tripartite-type tricarboxylate transporter receptor subunit TctC